MTSFDDDSRAAFNKRALEDPSSGAVLALHQAHDNVYRDYISKLRVVQALRPRPSDLILDFGCGVGRLSLHIAPHVKRIEGVDRAEEMVKLAQEQANRLGVENARFTHVTPGRLPFADTAFTKVLTFWALQHTSDEEIPGVLSEFRRVLAPGGTAVAIEQVGVQRKQATAINIHRTPDEYKALFMKNGFRVALHCHVIRNPSRSLWVWSRWRDAPRWVLPMLAVGESLLMNRKPEHVEYYTDQFVLEKADG